jgi:ABC-type thiamin/hydroxymethylpyrimidine transport system permease subunit
MAPPFGFDFDRRHPNIYENTYSATSNLLSGRVFGEIRFASTFVANLGSETNFAVSHIKQKRLETLPTKLANYLAKLLLSAICVGYYSRFRDG